jgi:hypothetical protein
VTAIEQAIYAAVYAAQAAIVLDGLTFMADDAETFDHDAWALERSAEAKKRAHKAVELYRRENEG